LGRLHSIEGLVESNNNNAKLNKDAKDVTKVADYKCKDGRARGVGGEACGARGWGFRLENEPGRQGLSVCVGGSARCEGGCGVTRCFATEEDQRSDSYLPFVFSLFWLPFYYLPN
jgi:hypothetical protein